MVADRFSVALWTNSCIPVVCILVLEPRMDVIYLTSAGTTIVASIRNSKSMHQLCGSGIDASSTPLTELGNACSVT